MDNLEDDVDFIDKIVSFDESNYYGLVKSLIKELKF